MPPEQGQSAVVVPAPAAEPLVAAWRERFDPSAAHGMPAHLTIPHLTIAHGAGDGVLDEIEAALRPRLPITARLPEACLYVFDGARWRPRARLPFQGDGNED